jgi:hypothetical protein
MHRFDRVIHNMLWINGPKRGITEASVTSRRSQHFSISGCHRGLARFSQPHYLSFLRKRESTAAEALCLQDSDAQKLRPTAVRASTYERGALSQSEKLTG